MASDPPRGHGYLLGRGIGTGKGALQALAYPHVLPGQGPNRHTSSASWGAFTARHNGNQRCLTVCDTGQRQAEGGLGPAGLGVLLLHELGHAGRSRPHRRSDADHGPILQPTRTAAWGAGDLRGLAHASVLRLAASSPCSPQRRPLNQSSRARKVLQSGAGVSHQRRSPV